MKEEHYKSTSSGQPARGGVEPQRQGAEWGARKGPRAQSQPTSDPGAKARPWGQGDFSADAATCSHPAWKHRPHNLHRRELRRVQTSMQNADPCGCVDGDRRETQIPGRGNVFETQQQACEVCGENEKLDITDM